ncbi:g7002 [Coccomyxa viridis]|uniref:G7002 protein n=1 Tax=Coccomyxa viridis TaxID=1274662 RepID=A0ABP1FZ79_9CHLO
MFKRSKLQQRSEREAGELVQLRPPEPMQFLGGFRVYVVNEACHVQGALDSLRASMTDRVVGIDLEWRPDIGRSQKHKVALMQLASSTCAVLIRTCRMDTLPACLNAFLQDPSTALVGFSWDAADENKARSSFGLGRKNFGLFYDAQKIAAQLSYSRFGLGRLCEAILGLDLPKPKHVTMSDWEQKALSQQQIVYAALDALVTGQLFRGLRLLHSDSSWGLSSS